MSIYEWSVLIRDWTTWIGEWLIAVYVVREFYYDAAKDAKPKKTRKKGVVKVVVDAEGQATIANQPPNVDVEITQKGEE